VQDDAEPVMFLTNDEIEKAYKNKPYIIFNSTSNKKNGNNKHEVIK
jgi:hypothetical protein